MVGLHQSKLYLCLTSAACCVLRPAPPQYTYFCAACHYRMACEDAGIKIRYITLYGLV